MKKYLILLFFLFGLLFPDSMDAQTQIERSTNIKTIGGKEYYMHYVKWGETLYRISLVYNVSIEEIEALNPDVKNGLKAEHVISIPVRPYPKPAKETPKQEPSPEPVVLEPKGNPVVEPVVAEPQRESVVDEPEPVIEPELVVTESEPEPVVVESETVVVESEAIIAETETIIVEPETVVVEPETVVVEPETNMVESEPETIVVETDPVVESKPVVEESVLEETQIDRSPFFDGKYRIVQRGENLYDIAKEYGIDLADFKAINQGLTNNPKAGTRIEIPNIANENDYILHKCEKNEKVISLLKRWKVSEGEFRAKNVSVGSHVFENQVVLIPIAPITDFYWISDYQSGNDENELEAPDQGEFSDAELEQSQFFFDRIFEPESGCVASPHNAHRHYKVALMVPLYLQEVSSLEISKESLPRLQKARSFSFLQFYEGFMMAVRELKDQGLILDLTVIDVTDNVSTAQNALSQIQGMNLDLIVGPFFGKSFEVIEEYAMANNIVVVNPLSTRNSVVEDNPNVVKVKPGEIGQILTISNLVRNCYFDSNIFIISREKSADSAFLDQLEHHLNHAVNNEVAVSGSAFMQFARNESQRLEMGSRMVSTVDVEGQVYSVDDFDSGTTERVVLANPVKRYQYSGDNIGKLKSQLSGVRNNLIVAYGNDNVFATQVLNALAKETDRYPITLVAIPDWAKFEKLLVENLLQMNAIYLDDGFVDYNSEAVKRFVIRFRQEYAAEPQMYAFEGYDLARFFLTALMRYGDNMLDCLNCCDVPLLHTQYRFFNRNHMRWEQGNGRENQYWNVYQYDNELIELKPIDPFKKKVE